MQISLNFTKNWYYCGNYFHLTNLGQIHWVISAIKFLSALLKLENKEDVFVVNVFGAISTWYIQLNEII